ncbi:hypothetical protein [Escherichia coli]|uniref:Y-family DNA polymerase n=1 Tax=Escherichia coli TaxID=562 RepID=UPI00398C63C1
MSNRVVALLEELSPRVEQYSIDECFLDARELATVWIWRILAGSCVGMFSVEPD